MKRMRKVVAKLIEKCIFSGTMVIFIIGCITQDTKADNDGQEYISQMYQNWSKFVDCPLLDEQESNPIDDFFAQKEKEEENQREMQENSTVSRMVSGEEKTQEDYEMEEQIRQEELRKKEEAEKKKRLEEKKRKEKERRKKEAEKKKNAYKINVTAKEISMLEHLCHGEAGNQSDECQQAVVSVVLNRVKSKNYPKSIEGVIFQKGQYACTWDGNYDKKPTRKVKKNVQAVLKGKGIDVPKSVVFQAQFKQGKGVWKKIGTEIFCYNK